MSEPDSKPPPPPKSVKNTAAAAAKKAPHGLGYKPDTHDKSKDKKARALLGAVLHGSQLPPDASMENLVDLVRDQVQTSCCTGFAFARSIHIRLQVVKTPVPWPSPTCLYTLGRRIGGEGQGQLTDEGAQPYAVVMGAQEWGTASSYAWGFDPATINAEPNLKELEGASSLEIQEFYRIDEEGAARTQRAQQAIAAGYPVIVGTQVDQAFNDYDGTGVVDAPDPDTLLGGHMLCVVGYRTVTDPATKVTSVQFRVVNSWGPTWGDKGFFWATQAWMESALMSDVYVLECNALPQQAA